MKKHQNETTEQFEARQQEHLELVRMRRYRTGNPKKHPAWSRRHKNRDLPQPKAVYTPYLLLHLNQFTSHSGPQKQINFDLFKRANVARRQGGYFKFQEMDRK